MSSSRDQLGDQGSQPEAPKKELPPAAIRALEEAKARRAEIDRRAAERAKELPARDGLDPARYGDWEKNGIASDF